jgi:hypothetical protein
METQEHPERGNERMNTSIEFDGIDTLTVPDGGNPIWIKIGGLTLQITPPEPGCGVIVDAWRADDAAMAEPWTVEFDGTLVEVR